MTLNNLASTHFHTQVIVTVIALYKYINKASVKKVPKDIPNMFGILSSLGY